MSSFQTTNFKILLFSKYSENSKKILALIKDNNLFDSLNIHSVCIDNENIRKRILNSDIEIIVVPCLLIIKDKIQIEKFEGQELNNWLSFQIQQQHMLQPPPIQQQHMLQQSQSVKQDMSSTEQQQIPIIISDVDSTQIDDLLLLDEGEDDDVDNVVVDIEHESNNNIEELTELTEIAVQEITKKPRKKENKYNNSHSHDYNEYETKNKKKDQKKLDLLNAAMMMKKSREDEDKNINKNFLTM